MARGTQRQFVATMIHAPFSGFPKSPSLEFAHTPAVTEAGSTAAMGFGPGQARKMRDPARIPFILRDLGKLWAETPDLRLGQLIVNAVGRDPFYIEDEKLVKAIETFVSQYRPVANPGETVQASEER